MGDEPLGENSESCVNHERYRRCKRGDALRTKVSHWGNLGRQNVFCEAQVRRPAHAVIPSLRVTRPGVFLYRENGRSIVICCGLFLFRNRRLNFRPYAYVSPICDYVFEIIPHLRHLLKSVPSSSYRLCKSPPEAGMNRRGTSTGRTVRARSLCCPDFNCDY